MYSGNFCTEICFDKELLFFSPSTLKQHVLSKGDGKKNQIFALTSTLFYPISVNFHECYFQMPTFLLSSPNKCNTGRSLLKTVYINKLLLQQQISRHYERNAARCCSVALSSSTSMPPMMAKLWHSFCETSGFKRWSPPYSRDVPAAAMWRLTGLRIPSPTL